MENFKILFPAGYNITEITDDNIDVNVILSNGFVYFATFFTISNIKNLMNKDLYFWSTDMIVVKNLEKETIKKIVLNIIDEELLETSFSKIGTIKEIYSENENFEGIMASI